MTDAERQKLVERVVKLYSLAAGTQFAGEAATAQRMAEELVAKHNLTLPSAKDRTAIAVVTWEPTFKGAKWEWMLADAVAQLCGCMAVFRGGEKLLLFRFVGTIADVEVCQHLLSILHQQRMRLWVRAKAEGTSDSFYSFCYSFAQGVARQVEHRLGIEERKRRQLASEWLTHAEGPITSYDLGTAGQGRSAAGRAAGEGASLHRGEISTASTLKRLTRR